MISVDGGDKSFKQQKKSKILLFFDV